MFFSVHSELYCRLQRSSQQTTAPCRASANEGPLVLARRDPLTCISYRRAIFADTSIPQQHLAIMFSRSYATSHVLEAAANNPASDSLQQLSARTPPAALAAPVVVDDLFTDSRTAEVVAEEETAEQEEAPIASTSAAPLPEKRNARTSILGRALFPPCESLLTSVAMQKLS
jgi:hypothetical protein